MCSTRRIACSGAIWDAERERLGDAATRTIERYAPGFASTVLAREVITPLDLERTYGLTGGHIFHGELALDQLLRGAAVARMGALRHADPAVCICAAPAPTPAPA